MSIHSHAVRSDARRTEFARPRINLGLPFILQQVSLIIQDAGRPRRRIHGSWRRQRGRVVIGDAVRSGPRSGGDRRFLAGFGQGLAGVLPIDEDAVVDDQDDVGPAVAIHVTDGHVARLDRIAGIAEVLALENLERDGREQLRIAGEGGDLQRLFADVGEDDVGAAVAVDVAGGEVGEPGLVALGSKLAIVLRRWPFWPVCSTPKRSVPAISRSSRPSPSRSATCMPW